MTEVQAQSEQGYTPVSTSTLVNLSGGLVSLGLVVAACVWGYNTLSRDVSEVPVVRAATDPMRVAPDDPGGRLAGNIGLAVNKVAAEGLAEKPADRLILAPAPVRLSTEDRPGQMITAEREAAERAAEAAQMAAAEQADPVAALTARLLKDAAPLSGETVAPPTEDSNIALALLKAEQQAEAQETKAAMIVDQEASEHRTLRPRMRPVVMATTAPQAPIAAPSPLQPAVDVDPASITAGTVLTQLGAYDSIETARKEWTKFQNRFADYMTDKQRVIQKASSGGRTFYRLRVMNFDDMSGARHFCAALVAENADCIPLVAK
ncbi:SPOR domain-containing protein [Pseudooceanicola sp. MF1-13]|uniref:SPOR domain-containing protein n=1 Tax=Pseudooceanicola sp. MF1-13 TaxID=3379095 RepID=UPI00389136DE